MTIGDFVAVNTFLIQLYMPLNMLGFAYREIRNALVNMEKMFGLLEVPAEIADRPGAPAALVEPDRAQRRVGAALHGHLRPLVAPARAARHAEARHRRDARKRLAAKSEGAEREEVFCAGDLACGVSLQAKERVVPRHAFAVVGHLNERQATLRDLDADAPEALVPVRLGERGGEEPSLGRPRVGRERAVRALSG